MAELPASRLHGARSADAEATLAALRERGDETVDRLLRENDPHWRSLSEADRRTVEVLARAIASRLLDRPAGRLAAPTGARVRRPVRTYASCSLGRG